MIQVSDLEDEPNRFSSTHTSDLIVTHIDNSFEEEEEEMALNRKKGLRELLADRAKGPMPKYTSGSQRPLALPPSPPPTVNQFVVANLKKKRKEKEVAKEGELVPQKEPKQ